MEFESGSRRGKQEQTNLKPLKSQKGLVVTISQYPLKLGMHLFSNQYEIQSINYRNQCITKMPQASIYVFLKLYMHGLNYASYIPIKYPYQYKAYGSNLW